MNILIAAGGTGGHLFPGIALAEAFKQKDERNQILFVGTQRDQERRMLIPPGCAFEAIDAKSVKGQKPIRMLIALLCLTKGIVQSGMIIKRFAPHLVIGCGGYVSAPVLVAAYLMGVKRAIHEQNALPGLTNRALSTIAQIIFISFQQSLPYFSKARTVIAGNPLRKQHLERSAPPISPPPFTLLILGGSLGSHQINCALTEALPDLVPIREKLTIIHQTGTADLGLVKEAYSRQGFAAEVVPFIEQIASAYERAHLIISRSGATTLAELMVHHKASILIPYPFAADNHQHHNAMALVCHNAAQMIDPQQLTGRVLAERILHLYHNPHDLRALGENAGTLGRPQAAQEIVDHCYTMLTEEVPCTRA